MQGSVPTVSSFSDVSEELPTVDFGAGSWKAARAIMESTMWTVQVISGSEYFFQLDHPVGAGSSGTVYPAFRSSPEGKLFALKCLHDYYRPSTNLATHLKEAANLKLARMYVDDFADLETNKFMTIQEFVEGMTVEEAIYSRPNETLQSEFIQDLREKYLEGLSRFHREVPLLHRDAKPQNCILAPDGLSVRFVDVGNSESAVAIEADILPQERAQEHRHAMSTFDRYYTDSYFINKRRELSE
jgi:serine/threonine protein kinase